MTDNEWENFIKDIAAMEAEGKMTHSAATIEALKKHFPTDYAEMIRHCKEMGVDPSNEITEFIDWKRRR